MLGQTEARKMHLQRLRLQAVQTKREGLMRITLTGRRLALAAVLVLVVSLVTATSSAPYPAGTLDLRGTLRVVSEPVQCPPEAPPDAAECSARTGGGSVSGLGTVSQTYTWSIGIGPPTCPTNVGKPLATTGRLVVVGKGEIQFALAEGARCIEQLPLRNEPQAFTITGGTGTYEGASGSGTLERVINAGRGRETWTGTLVVAGLEFDVTPPTLSGATSKTVRARKGAKRARVTYNVTAADAVDGRVPVTCQPRSGSRFPIGRTAVSCSATDSSANTRKASFRVTVRRL